MRINSRVAPTVPPRLRRIGRKRVRYEIPRFPHPRALLSVSYSRDNARTLQFPTAAAFQHIRARGGRACLFRESCVFPLETARRVVKPSPEEDGTKIRSKYLPFAGSCCQCLLRGETWITVVRAKLKSWQEFSVDYRSDPDRVNVERRMVDFEANEFRVQLPTRVCEDTDLFFHSSRNFSFFKKIVHFRFEEA